MRPATSPAAAAPQVPSDRHRVQVSTATASRSAFQAGQQILELAAFNARLRAECLNASWFLSMTDARYRIDEWRCAYNEDRSHSALGNLTPKAFASQAHQAPRVAKQLDQSWGQVQPPVH